MHGYLEATFNNPLLPGKNRRRDDFILQVILAHAENNSSMTKAFFSENTKEFGNTNIPDGMTKMVKMQTE